MHVNRDGEWHESETGRYRVLAQQENERGGIDDLRQIESEPFTGYAVVSDWFLPHLPHHSMATMQRFQGLPDAIKACAGVMGVAPEQVRRAIDLTRGCYR